MAAANSGVGSKRRDLLICAALLALVLVVLFWRSFTPGGIIFANDGPLGAMAARQNRMPDIMTGFWGDLNWLGGENPPPAPDISAVVRLVTTPLLYSKFLCPISIFVLGLCACFAFRQMKFAPLACVLGGVAAALNSDYFSNACWGQESRPLTLSAAFLAMAALENGAGWRAWAKTALAGMAVGLGVMEGFDVGAIFSLFLAAYVLVQTWVTGQGTALAKSARGLGRVVLVAACAGFIAFETVTALVGTQIKGVAGMEQPAQTPEERQANWDWATQWSLPKVEALNIVVPGLFGFRMIPPPMDGSVYWGSVGMTPGWETHHQGYPRFGGGGAYGGVLVVTVAIWALAQSFRRKDSPYSNAQRRLVWFWAAVALVCLLLAFGRYAPFYRLFYALPHASAIRNPTKFMHVFDWSLLVLFGYGVHGLVRSYLGRPLAQSSPKSWWTRLSVFDRKWTLACVAVLVAAFVGWMIYSGSRASLVNYLQAVQFDGGTAATIANFSIRQVGWFIVRLAAVCCVLTMILSGVFCGPKAKTGGILLGALLMLDQYFAVQPFVAYWDWPQKYATNPVIQLLSQKPYEQRVTILPMDPATPLKRVYDVEWLQQLFQYYDIQSLDVIQMPRTPQVYAAFEGAMRAAGMSRHWQLTNTRFLLGPAAWLDSLNDQLDPVKRRFRIAMRFNLAPKPGVLEPILPEQITAVADTNGPYALYDFAGALPRARLYSNWQVSTNFQAARNHLLPSVRKLVEQHALPKDFYDSLAQAGTNDQATLAELVSDTFDPEQTVLLADPLPEAPITGPTNQPAGTVDFTSYAPKDFVLKADAKLPAVLLVNDQYDPNWRVSVDGKPAPLLRCNYIMRGVYVPAGIHTIEFRFRMSLRPLYISLTGIAVALALIGILIATKPKQAAPEVTRPSPAKSDRSQKPSRSAQPGQPAAK